jgi:hypothetical protein
MTDLDTLREALRQEAGQSTLDIQVIVTLGRRRRRRRRLAVAGGAICLAVVAFGAVAGFGHSAGSPPVPAQRPVAPASTTHRPPPRRAPAPAPSPRASASPTAVPSGPASAVPAVSRAPLGSPSASGPSASLPVSAPSTATRVG